MSSRSKHDLELLRKLFPATHERFRVKRCSAEEIDCVFVGPNGKEIAITGKIAASSLFAVWYTDVEDEEVASTLSELSKATGNKSMLLVQVRKLIANLCSMYNVTPPTELSKLIAADEEEKKSGEQSAAHDLNTDTSAENELKKVRAALLKKHMSGSTSNVTTTRRLMKEYQEIINSEAHRKGEIAVELVDGDNLYEWNVKVRRVDEDSGLAKDLKTLKEKHGQDFIQLSLRFTGSYPFTFPLVAIVTPRLQGGHVFKNGAVCLELLTTDRWSSAYTAEKVILQVISLLCTSDARIRFDESTMIPYGRGDLEGTYEQIGAIHRQSGWYTPPKQKG